jgi:hypothetical protein
VTAVDDVVIRNQFRDERLFIPHGTDEFFPGVDAVSDVVILGDIYGIVFSLSHFFEGPDLFAADVLIPGPIALGKEAVGKDLIIAIMRSPELHHDIEYASLGTGFLCVVTATLNVGACGFDRVAEFH